MTAQVDITHLSKSFGALRAVDDISFSVAQGEVLGFLGPNGAGKSTTMRMLTGFLPPSAGTAVVCGHDVIEQSLEARRAIGYLAEGAPLYGEMTPSGFLSFVAEVRGFSGAERDRRVARAVERTQLSSVVGQRIETLSKGFKRRVGLAQAILHDPRVLILDEPTDGLDPNQKHEVRRLIREMGQDKAIILSTHILEEVHAVCTRAIIIARGRVLADGTPEDLQARSRLHLSLSLAVRGSDGAELLEAVRSVDGVKAVEPIGADDGLARLRVFPGAGRDVAPAVSRRITERGWDLEELSVERGRLDDVFRAITTSEEAGA